MNTTELKKQVNTDEVKTSSETPKESSPEKKPEGKLFEMRPLRSRTGDSSKREGAPRFPFKKGDGTKKEGAQRRPHKKDRFGGKQPKMEFEEKLVTWKHVSKTTKGGRQSRIWTLVVIGNKKGQVGFGIGKAKEFPDSMKKAVKNALKNVVKVKINKNGTVYHENIGKHSASKVLIKPAKVGIGIIAGGPIKIVLELAGYTDVYSKNLGSNTAMNMVRATIKALEQQRTPVEVAKLRDRKVSEL